MHPEAPSSPSTPDSPPSRLIDGARNLARRARRRLAWERYRIWARWRAIDGKRRDRAFARAGNLIETHGLKISVDNPLIKHYQKAHIRDGVHEADEVKMLRAHLDPTLPTIELGGSIGVVACLTNQMLKNPEAHVVVEANPLMIPTLEKNRDLNGCRFEIVNAAAAYGAPTVEFMIGDDSMTGRLGGEGEGTRKVVVPAVSLRELIESRGFGAINLIVDIEGAEIAMVDNELDVIRDHVRLFMLETHERYLNNEGLTFQMIDSLRGAGFQILEGNPDDPAVLVFSNAAIASQS